MAKKQEQGWAWELSTSLLPHDVSVPLSLILPVYNCSSLLRETLESLQNQNYPELEVIVIDAGSSDHTLEIVGSYPSLISRLYTVAEPHLYEMINRGISLASGRYITVLLPGSCYISTLSLRAMADLAIKNDHPDLLYSGSIQREGVRAPRQIYLPFSKEALRSGSYLTTLSACWFRHDLFETLGKFRPRYSIRAGFDLLCRIAESPHMRIATTQRVYIDFDFGHFTYRKLVKWSTETFTILRAHYGLRKALVWFLGFNHLRFMRWWLNTLKQKLFRV